MPTTSENAALAIVKLAAAAAPAPIVGSPVLGLVTRDYQKTEAQAGDAVDVSVPPIAQGGGVSDLPPNRRIALNTLAEATFQIPDVRKILAVPGFMAAYMSAAMTAIVERIERDLMSLYTNFTANTAVGSSGTITEAVIDSAEASLFSANVPPHDQKYLVVNAATYDAMRLLPCFEEFQTARWKAGGQGSTNSILEPNMAGEGPTGANGKAKNFLVFRSHFIQKPWTTTYNMAFHRDALGLAIRRPPSLRTGAIAEYAETGDFGVRIVLSWDPNSLAQQVTVACLYGCAVIRDSFGIHVQSNN
jgi:hypothetical protein